MLWINCLEKKTFIKIIYYLDDNWVCFFLEGCEMRVLLIKLKAPVHKIKILLKGSMQVVRIEWDNFWFTVIKWV